jgi:hypothetical protein
MNIFKLFLLLFVSLILVSCRKEKASWNTDWSAPIVNDTLSLVNLVNDSTIQVNQLGNYELDLTRTLFDLSIADFISIPDTVINHSFVNVVPSLSVPPGFSFVNEIEEHQFDLQGVQLKKIHVSKGEIQIKVSNPLETKAFFVIKLPGVTKDGILFSQTYSVDGGSIANPNTETTILDLSGYDIDLTGQGGGAYNLLQSQLIISSDPSGPSVVLTNSHIFNVEATFKDIKIDYARGYFGNKVLTASETVNIDFLNAVTAGTIDLPNTAIQFDLENGLKADAKATIFSLANTNYSGNQVSLTGAQIGTPIILSAATGSWSTLNPSTEVLNFNSSNSNIEAYLENLGTQHQIAYKIELNPWGNTSGGWNEIFPNSRLRVRLNAQMPLTIAADGLTLRDTFDFDMSQNTNQPHVESGTITLNATNAFPIEANTVLFLLDDQGQILHTLYASDYIASSMEGSVDPNDGLKKAQSLLSFELTKAMVNDLNSIKKVAVQATFNTPNESGTAIQPAAIPEGAFLAVKLHVKFNVKVLL